MCVATGNIDFARTYMRPSTLCCDSTTHWLFGFRLEFWFFCLEFEKESDWFIRVPIRIPSYFGHTKNLLFALELGMISNTYGLQINLIDHKFMWPKFNFGMKYYFYHFIFLTLQDKQEIYSSLSENILTVVTHEHYASIH